MPAFVPRTLAQGLQRCPSMSSDKPTAVIVDDDREYREAVGDLLREEGYPAVTAGTLDEARAAIRAAKRSVVLLDLELVGERGDELLEEFLGRVSAPPTIVVSGEIDGKERARRYGRRFVSKPSLRRLLDEVAYASTRANDNAVSARASLRPSHT
jgi:two-component system, OmpR family, response regulator RegX3